MSTTTYHTRPPGWDDDYEPRDKSRSRAARQRVLQRRVTRWEKYGDDFRKLGGR